MLQDSRLKEESLPNGHGLETVDWRGTLSSGIKNVLNLKVRACNGTFPILVNSIGNGQSYTWFHGSSNAGFRKDFGEVKFLTDKTSMSLDDLLSREVSLLTEYAIMGLSLIHI